MTNGEKLKEVFPNMRITVCESYVQVIGENYEFNNLYPLDWWNAEYKEPTTKNELGVDAISRADARKAIIDHQYSDSFCEEHNIDHSINTSMALIALSELPSVTPQEPKTGHWYRQTNDYVDYYECSECGMAMGLYDVKSYCPNCGSRNEVEE